MQIRAAGAIIFDEQRRLLLIRRGRSPGKGLWSVPGGKCESSESAAEACIRETAEETGLVVEIAHLAGRVVRPASNDSSFLIEDYVCRVVSGTLRPGDDACEARWFTSAELARLPTVDLLVETLGSWGLLPA